MPVLQDPSVPKVFYYYSKDPSTLLSLYGFRLHGVIKMQIPDDIVKYTRYGDNARNQTPLDDCIKWEEELGSTHIAAIKNLNSRSLGHTSQI